MQRAAIVSGVLGLGSVLVFGAAALASALFPNGGTVNAGWNSFGGVRGARHRHAGADARPGRPGRVHRRGQGHRRARRPWSRTASAPAAGTPGTGPEPGRAATRHILTRPCASSPNSSTPTTASSAASSRSSTRPTSSRTSSRPSPTTRSASGSTVIRAEIAEVAAPEEPSDDELNHPDSSAAATSQGAPQARQRAAAGRPRRGRPRGVRRRPRGDASGPWACATSTSSSMGAHRAPPGQDRRDEDGRGQDPRPDPRPDAQRPHRPRRPRRHRQRLPGPPRRPVDGARRSTSSGCRWASSPTTRRYLFEPGFPTTDERLINLRPVTRREAYAADITYGTNNEFGFDYLRDNMVDQLDGRVQRERSFAIVDEVDNILIDEARTPLIISGQAEESADLYFTFARLVPKLKERPEGDGGGRRLLPRPQGQGVSARPRTASTRSRSCSASRTCTTPIPRLARHFDSALKAHALYKRDRDYIVEDGEIVIVDEFTGRKMPGRRWSEGLHQAIEAKEGLRVQRESRTLATITFQNYFRLYDKLAGMTGTAMTEAEEFHKIYGLEVVAVPTHRPMIRDDYAGPRVQERASQVQRADRRDRGDDDAGRPVLVGTVSVEKSEVLSTLLKRRGDQARDAQRQVPREGGGRSSPRPAAAAPSRSPPTWPAAAPTSSSAATRRASPRRSSTSRASTRPRWTQATYDAALEEAKAITERRPRQGRRGGRAPHHRHRAPRRAGGSTTSSAAAPRRQGDPGSSRFYLSLDDDLMKRFASDRVAGLMERLGLEDDVAIESNLVSQDDRERPDPRRGLQLRHPQARRRVRRRHQQAARDDLRRARQGPAQRGPHRDRARVPRGRGRRDGGPVPGRRHVAGRVEPRGPRGGAAGDGHHGPGTTEAELDEVRDSRDELVEPPPRPRRRARSRRASRSTARRSGRRSSGSCCCARSTACGSSTSPSSTTCGGASASAATPSRTRSTSSARRRSASTRSSRDLIRRQVATTIFRVTVTRREPVDRPAVRARPAARRGSPCSTRMPTGRSTMAHRTTRRPATAAAPGARPRRSRRPRRRSPPARPRSRQPDDRRRGRAPGLPADPMRTAREAPGDGAARRTASARASRPSGARIGRNDPCWCGSGQKYKKCHGA